jgi:uncharacterized protein GlcG (DUF336 family)
MSKIHRLAGVSLATALACGLATSANAQLLQHKDLSSATAIDACKQAGYNVSVHVVGRNGEVLVGLRHHAAGVNTFENSWKKAYTSRTFRTPSGKFAENVGQNPVAGQLFLANITAARGALPIMIGEETIGAVGVSGAPGGEKDEACAQAGIDKVKDQLR